MKSFFFFLAIFGLVAGVGQAADGNASTKPNDTIIESLHRFDAVYAKSLIDGKSAAILSQCAENVRLMPEFQLTTQGKANATAYFAAFLDRFQIEAYRRQSREVLDLGTAVAEVGLFTLTLIEKRNGQRHAVAGKYLDLWEKAPNEDLALVTEAWNYSGKVEISDQLRFESVPSVNLALQPHLPIKDDISFELAALNRLMEGVVSQHDDKVWAQLYPADGMFIYSGHPIYEGQEALQGFLAQHVKELPIFEHLDIRNDHIEVSGKYVIEYATHTAHWRNGDSSGVNTGKDLRIWRRQPEGALKLYRHIGMYD